MRLTWMVIAVAVTIGIFLGFIDLGFSRLFDVILGVVSRLSTTADTQLLWYIVHTYRAKRSA